MEKIFEKIKNTVNHLEILHNIFINEDNFDIANKIRFEINRKKIGK